MQLKTRGLVIKQRDIGENDKIITILTKDFGIIEASARGIKRSKNTLSVPCQMLCYSEFCIFKGKNYYIINSAEVLNSFYDIRLDVTKLALSGYFCEITNFISPSTDVSWDFLRFILNTLHFIERDLLPLDQIKAIFELRGLSMVGFMPNIVCCKECSEYERDKMFFFPLDGCLICEDCIIQQGITSELKYQINKSALTAMRHIIYSESDKVFSFKLGKSSIKQLSFLTECYVIVHTDSNFKSLEIYKSLSAVSM